MSSAGMLSSDVPGVKNGDWPIIASAAEMWVKSVDDVALAALESGGLSPTLRRFYVSRSLTSLALSAL